MGANQVLHENVRPRACDEGQYVETIRAPSGNGTVEVYGHSADTWYVSMPPHDVANVRWILKPSTLDTDDPPTMQVNVPGFTALVDGPAFMRERDADALSLCGRRTLPSWYLETGQGIAALDLPHPADDPHERIRRNCLENRAAALRARR